ncbi:ATP-grasp fold amidoligase family protein [Alkalihalobacillus trypoxylicola]|uniref:Glycosyl transferase n=1 Tax=Alkalihalobacillus trypoxylicola TaxID=519424 RepID=A0A161PDV1_9BACI|nr:ATP-grasp fold amidoligase family protein [Alkalihalobacillus trypoxylicola]KYG30594.1 glycosyl transferase [Alkalihalobacillus trypoxylicola]
MTSKLKKVLKQPQLLLHLLIKKAKIFRLLSDETYIKINYKLRLRQKLNLSNPQSFNEKLQWLKLYNRKREYSLLVDKFEVRNYIAETIGEKYLIPLLGVYNCYDEINFDELPDQFVLKPNHTSGDVYICKDKSKINHSKLRRDINKWLKREYFWVHREWPYKNIKPRIICEKYMVDETGLGLNDFKLMCFNGKVKCTFVCLNRETKKGVNIDIYDQNWNLMPFGRKHRTNSGSLTTVPQKYHEMKDLAHKISEYIPFVRVDFYEFKGELYFGEITFYPGSGYEEFTPNSYDLVLGSWLKIH